MKKFLSVLLCLMLVLSITSVSCAEGEPEGTEVVEAEPLEFSIRMDAIPEGYELEAVELDDCLYAFFINEQALTEYMASVARSDYFPGYTLKLDELTEEMKQELIIMLSDGYNEPVFSYDKTSHGTDVIIINENGAADDWLEIVTIYEGYFISVATLSEETLTDADVAIALQLMSDLWVEE